MAKQQKTNEEIIKGLKKANKQAREVTAKRAGFKSSEAYIQFLEGNSVIGGSKTVAPKKVETVGTKIVIKPTIHVVDILDATASMTFGGNKYKPACEGIREGIRALEHDNSVNYTYSLIEFVQTGKIIEHFFLSKIFSTSFKFNGAFGGNTPLYFTVYDTILKLQQKVKDSDKVLIKVYTDGGNNTLHQYRPLLESLIAEVNSKNFTVTFVATETDMPTIIRELNLDGSNTLRVSNDRGGFEKAFQASLGATMSYAANVKEGKDVLKGFYKKSGTL